MMSGILAFALKEQVDVKGKGKKKNIQGRGMTSAQILKLSYKHMRHYLSLSMYVCSLETKMLIKWQTK